MPPLNTTWLIIIVVIYFAAFIIGTLKSRGLSKKKQAQIMRNYLAIPLIIFIFFILLSKPYVPSISYLSYASKETDYPLNLDSKETALKLAQNHDRQIEDLETEVKRLREDLYETVSFDRYILLMLAIGLIGPILMNFLNSIFFKKAVQKAREEEMQEIYEEIKARLAKDNIDAQPRN